MTDNPKIKPYPKLVWNYCLDSRFSRRIQNIIRSTRSCKPYTELRIKHWTGVCDASNKKILGLGNDIYQIAVALIDAEKRGATKLSLIQADEKRLKNFGAKGITNLFPSLTNGIAIKGDQVQHFDYAESISQHWQMADYDSFQLRRVLIRYLKNYLTEYITLDADQFSETLVVHLRGGDALTEKSQKGWRPSPLEQNFYRDAIHISGLKNIHVVTTPPINGAMHPMAKFLEKKFGATIQHESILGDFSVLARCQNIVLDYSTFGYTAALINENLKNVFIARYKDKKGNHMLRNINSDVGFTFPTIDGVNVFVYDYPGSFVKKGIC